jgi:glutamate/tyrosine decarboxylase-like PLP-dependent enzyme
MSDDASIDLDPEDFRRLGYRAVDLVADRLRTVRGDAVRAPVPEALKREWLAEPAPVGPASPDAVLTRVAETVLAHPMGNGSPRFFGWVNSPPAPLAILAELLAAGLDPSVAGGDHAATYVEHAVLDWLKAILGVPADAGAVLTSGGSVATLVGLGVMRHVKTGGADRALGMQAAGRPLAVYTSTQGHSCIQKAVEILGLGSERLRRVAVDAAFRMDVADLASRIRADRAAGLEPAAVVASAGTVNTGAIDPLDDIADLCAAEDLWLHVDGAYGGVAALDPATRPLVAGLSRADSLGVDPHKWLYVPVECGCAIVRDAQAMRNAFSLVPPYLRDDAAMPWFSEFTVQQTRGFKALKLWMVLQQVGLEGYGRLIAQDIARARALRARLRAHPDFALVSEGPLSITCFQYRPPWAGDADALNRQIAERVQRDGRAFLTTTELDGRSVLRACIVNFRTTDADLDELVEAIVAAGESIHDSQLHR